MTGDLIGNKIVDRITKVSKTSPQNNSETQTEILKKKRYESPEEIQKVINDLRLINSIIMEYQKVLNLFIISL